MRKETVDLSIRSWLCYIQVGSSLDVNLRLVVNCLEIGLINLIFGGICYKCPFHSFHSPKYDRPGLRSCKIMLCFPVLLRTVNTPDELIITNWKMEEKMVFFSNI